MSASGFRSHFRSQAQKEPPPTQRQSTQTSRIPTKPIDSGVAESKQGKATQHVSRLAKRTSKNIVANVDKDGYGAKSTPTPTVTPAPATTQRSQPETKSAAGVIQPPVAPTSTPHPQIARKHSLFPRPTIQTPSLVSGSSASSYDSPRSLGLRRKPSTIEQYAAAKRSATPKTVENIAAPPKEDLVYDTFERRVLDKPLPESQTGVATEHAATAPALPQHHFHAGQAVTRDVTPPVPNYAQTATPSTRYTDSPFSHVPTPSSASSYSPGVAVTTGVPPTRIRPQSPTRSRPPISGRSSAKGEGERLGLPPVRESSTSSSNSTVKPNEPRWPLSRKDVPPKSASAPPGKSNGGQFQQAARGKRVPPNPEPNPRSTIANAPVQAPVQIPPEFAHLNVEPPQKPNLNKPFPPLRPSRDGTPNLTGVNIPSPIVQSDLPRLYTTYHKRTPSQETPTSATSPSLKTRFGLSPKASSKQSSPRIDSAISPPPGARAFARGPTTDEQQTEGSKVSRKDSPAVGPSPSKSPRFGFWSRKPKPDNNKPVQKPKREPSKGPVAGTGHEGYGRFSMRSRTGSTSSNTGNGVRSPSMETTASSQKKRQSTSNKGSVSSRDGSDLDDFLKERMNPIILRGSGSTLGNTVSSMDSQVPSVPNSSKNSSLDSFSKPQLLPSAMDSAAGVSPAKQANTSRRVPSDSSEDDVAARYPGFAIAKPLNASSQLDWTPAGRVSSPLDTNQTSKDSSYDSYDAETSAWPQTDSSMPREDPFNGKEGLWLRSGKTEPESKAPRKWNFFQRAHASPRDKGKARESALVEEPVALPHQSPIRGGLLAHYAMFEPTGPVGLDEVERMIQENETSAEESMSENTATSRMVPYESRHASLLPYPHKSEDPTAFDVKAGPKPPRIMIRPDSEDSTVLMNAERTISHEAPHVVEIQRSPSIGARSDPWAEQKAMVTELKPEAPVSLDTVHTPDMPQAPFNTPENPDDSPARQPRLSPIGRIPKVVSKRDRERKLSDSSFSRPFVRTQPKPTVKPPGSLYTEIRELASPIESGSQPNSSTSTNSRGMYGEQEDNDDTIVPGSYDPRISMDGFGNEFFSFPARKDSEISYSSSSGYEGIRTALSFLPQSDDVWNEYDEWLDDIVPGTTRSTTPPLGAPFRYDSPAVSPLETSKPPPQSRRLPPLPGEQPARALPSLPGQVDPVTQPSSLTMPQPVPETVDQTNIRKARRLPGSNRGSGQSANSTGLPQPLRSSTSGPSLPGVSTANRTSIPGPSRSSLPRSSRSSVVGPNRSSLPRSDRSSFQGSIRSSARHSRSSGHSRSASLPEANIRNSQASLTPSARFNRDTQLLDIAEVDGDEQAAAANLRFGALMTSKWLSFGRVLFSPAHNEMRLADEPKVLIIDGLGSDWSYYVALSYPAATIYNLGPTQPNGMSDWPGVNQKPPSNHRHINHAAISAAFPFPKGFFTAVVFRFPTVTTDQAYQACVCECKRVLRPGGYLEVAALDLDLMNMGNKARRELRGLKTRMQQSDRNVSLRNLSDVLVRLVGRRGFEEVQRCIVGVPAAGRIPGSQDISSASSDGSGKPVWPREERHSQEFSFADLLEDARASQIGETKGNDENITKMVAKVGRWWYSTCYEKAILHTDNSIWHDATLLRECEKQGTSFRLLICYAQKPAQTTRRTVSV